MDLYLDGRHLGLNNLYRMVLSSPERGVEIVEDFLEQLLEGDDLANVPMPYSVAKSRIMPRIQPNSIFEQLEREQVAHAVFLKTPKKAPIHRLGPAFTPAGKSRPRPVSAD